MKFDEESRRQDSHGRSPQQQSHLERLQAEDRRLTAIYKQKQSLVKDIWIGSGLIIIFMPLSIQLTMLLATVFLSFCILDETEDY